MKGFELQAKRNFQEVYVERALEVPIWMWPNVLSLDAAFIAVLWNVFLAKLLRLQTGWAEPILLGLSVWVIYLADHILDSRQGIPPYAEPIRKVFHRRHQNAMLALAGFGTVGAAWLALFALPAIVFSWGILIAFSVLLYLATVHVTPVNHRRTWARELVVALLFAIGTTFPIALIARAQARLILASGASLFFLFWANCCVLETLDWYRADRHAIAAPSDTALWVYQNLRFFNGLVAVASGCLAVCHLVPDPFAMAVVISALALSVATSWNNVFSLDLRCFLVDAVLCSPLLIPFALWSGA